MTHYHHLKLDSKMFCFFVPEEGMTGGGTGGRDLARNENAEEDSEC